jgi:hypothetical protein
MNPEGPLARGIPWASGPSVGEGPTWKGAERQPTWAVVFSGAKLATDEETGGPPSSGQ